VSSDLWPLAGVRCPMPGCVCSCGSEFDGLDLALNSESGLDVPESDEDEEESVLVWIAKASPKSKPLDEDETGTRAPKPGDVPCLPLTGVSSVSGPEAIDEPRGTSKRRKLSPTSVYSDPVEKSATSIPAMVIPHLVSPRPVAPTGPTILDT
jgi:hypothetical protein